MIGFLRKCTDLVMKAFMAVGTLTMLVMAFAVFLQVIARYLGLYSIAWTEELSRFAFIWTSLFGSAIALDRGLHSSITMIPNRLKGAVKKIYHIGLMLLILVCSGIIVTYGWKLTLSSGFMRSVALGWPLTVQNIPIVISGLGMCLTIVTQILEQFTTENTEGKEPNQ